MGLLPTALTVPSPETGTDYRISLAPPDPARHPPPWQVVVVLDADDHFAAAMDAYRGLWARGLGRPWLLVGVGYGAGFKQPGNHRVRDYTHRAMAWEPESGGGGAFEDYLTNTLWPELERRYSIRRDGIGLAGHSLGGLFVLNALFRPNAFFHRGLAIAPSLWWDERATLHGIEERPADEPLAAERLFLGIGESDTESMRRDCRQLEQVLTRRAFEGLRVTTHWFDGRGHFNVVSVAFAAGFRSWG